MAKHFKDFTKEAKDLLSKNYAAPEAWKIESKEKGPDRTFVLSPVADFKAPNKGVLSVDVDYNLKDLKLKTKTNITSTGAVKPKVTYDFAPNQKVEATLMQLSAQSDFEIVYEGVVQGAMFYDKVTKTRAEGAVAYPVIPALTVGGSLTWSLKESQLESWSVGARYVDPRAIVSLVAKDLKTFTTAVYVPVPATCKALLSAITTCGNGVFSFEVGAEGKLNELGFDATVRAKVNQKGEVSFALIKKFVGNWTAAVSTTTKDVTKFGVQLTRE